MRVLCLLLAVALVQASNNPDAFPDRNDDNYDKPIPGDTLMKEAIHHRNALRMEKWAKRLRFGFKWGAVTICCGVSVLSIARTFVNQKNVSKQERYTDECPVEKHACHTMRQYERIDLTASPSGNGAVEGKAKATGKEMLLKVPEKWLFDRARGTRWPYLFLIVTRVDYHVGPSEQPRGEHLKKVIILNMRDRKDEIKEITKTDNGALKLAIDVEKVFDGKKVGEHTMVGFHMFWGKEPTFDSDDFFHGLRQKFLTMPLLEMPNTPKVPEKEEGGP